MFKEFCADFNRRYGTMVPASKEIKTGYCSLYWFFEEDAKEIAKAGHSRGLGRYKVYSNKLWFDFDEGEQSLENALPKIKSLGAPYAVYDSGGKGYHVSVDIVPMEGYDVPTQQALFVESLGVVCDMSLYRHDRILSNIGRIHPISGKSKVLLYKITEGELFNVPKPLVIKKPKQQTAQTVDLQIAMTRALLLLERDPKPGSRHTMLWSCAKDFCESGVAYEVALGLLLKINEQFKKPKEPQDVERAVAQAYEMEYYHAKIGPMDKGSP